MASDFNYGEINSVNTANLYKDKNFSVQQLSKSNTIRQHSELSLISQQDRNFSFKRNTRLYSDETNNGETLCAPRRKTRNHNKSKHTYNLRNWVNTEKH